MKSSNKQLTLKPQDLLVALKIAVGRPINVTFAALAAELYMSVSEVHAATKRAEIAHLLSRTEEGLCAVRSSLLEFVLHGLRYSFPPLTGSIVRGMPTGVAGPALRNFFEDTGEMSHVWPDPDGTVRGISFQPLYPTVPNAARRDVALYEILTLIDALRGGAARERELAREELTRRLA